MTTPHFNQKVFRSPFSAFLILIFISLNSLFTSCGNKTADEALVAPEGMCILDLSKYGKPFAIFVPDTAKAKLQVTEQTSGSLDIKVGSNFAISLFEQIADIELKKSDLKGDEVNKLKSFIVDEPKAILWESEITQPEFHFLINMTVAGADYSFQDITDNEVRPFGKESIQRMFDSCKNIKEVKKSPNS